MIEIYRTEDPVLLSALRAGLDQEGIDYVVFDDHTSRLYAGVLDAVPSRIMIADDDLENARRIIDDVCGGSARA